MSVITAPSAGRQARASSVGRPEAFYPSPFFDIAENYLPSTIRETFEWCAYYQRTNPIISTVTSRLAAYPITDIMFDEGNEGLVEEWRDLFETKLRIRQFLVEQNLDRYTFGNSFCTVSFPFVKKLTCRQCQHAVEASKAKYQWRDTKFMLHCQECDTQHEAKVHDEYQKNLEAVRLVRWNPRVIEIEYNEITGRSRYFYRMPQYLRNQITLGIPDVVQNVPQTFIDAIRKKKAILIESDKIFHSRRASISTNPGDQGWGAPLVLPVLKDIFFTQVLRKSQEAVCMEHIVPMRVLYPQVTGDGNNFYSQVNLKSWQKEVELQVTKWRQDPNHIPVLGFPLGYQLIGGQGRAILLHQELRVYFDQIVAGMGVPTSFFYGEAQYSGASVNLKALENEFLGNRQDMLRLVHFIRDAIAGGCDKTPIGMRFRPFKMADDIQRASYDLQLSQGGLISQRSLLQSRDFDYDREQTLLKTERSVQARVSRQQIVDQAAAQGEAQIIQAKYGAQAQVQQQEILNQNGMATPEQQQQQGQEQQGAAGQQAQQGQPQQPGQEQQAQPGQEQQPVESAGGQNLAVAARTVAQQLSAMSEVDQYHRLEQLRANNPNLYELVFRDLKSQGVRLRPNPEQLPSRGP